MTNIQKLEVLTDMQRYFLHKFWLNLMDDVDEGLMNLDDADYSYQMQLDYLYNEETNYDY